MNNLLDQIPGLREAIDAEQHVRDTSFLDLKESVGGFDVEPLTLRHVLLLGAVGSPFVRGGFPTATDIGVFMCIVGDWRGVKKFFNLQKLGKKNLRAISEDIIRYTEESFQDSPATSGVNGVSYYSFAASIVDLFGREYGWTERETLNVPLKRLFQYIRAISSRNGETMFFNPSDKVRGNWLKMVNSQN